MTPSAFTDPYVYEGTTVLKNRLGLQTQEELDLAEYRFTFERRIELDQKPIAGAFDFSRLKETHRRLFQDLYDWAGEPRTVDITKGSSTFLPSSFIDTAAADVFSRLAKSRLLTQQIDDDDFIIAAADLFEELNYLHPFREGNGRTQRAFLDQVAAVSGRKLSWRNVSERDHMIASVAAFNSGNGEPFRPVLQAALDEPMDGLSPLDPSTYRVGPAAAPRSPRSRRYMPQDEPAPEAGRELEF